MVICDGCGNSLGNRHSKVVYELVDISSFGDPVRKFAKLPVYSECDLAHEEIASGIFRGTTQKDETWMKGANKW